MAKNVTSRWQFEEHLKRKRYVELGSGMYGTVLARPGSDKVIKLGSNDEDGWPFFAALAATVDNPHFPVIYRLSWFNQGTKEAFFVAVLERLKPFSYSGPLAPQFEAVNALVYSGKTDHKIPEELRKAGELIYRDLIPWFHADLHSKNVMIRPSDDRLVITDPITSPKVPEIAGHKSVPPIRSSRRTSALLAA